MAGLLAEYGYTITDSEDAADLWVRTQDRCLCVGFGAQHRSRARAAHYAYLFLATVSDFRSLTRAPSKALPRYSLDS